MSDTILAGDFTVYYIGDGRRKQIKWTGAATDTQDINVVYSALQDLFDEATVMDDATPMSAQTPVEYTIGIIDSGDFEPWFIDKDTVEHITGGALKTSGWTRTTTSATGVVKITCSLTAFGLVQSDIGDTCTHSSADSGVILDVDETTYEVWIRPDDDTAANDWDTASGTITADTSSNVATVVTGAETGESLWANIYTIGTIADNSHVYINQEQTLLTAYKDTTDWWSDGAIDLLVNVKEVDVEVDDAVVQVFTRRFTATYDNFEVDLTAGGRNPIPFATGADLDNINGYREMAFSVSSGTFEVGEIIEDDTDSNIQGVVTDWDPTGNGTVQYYLIGDPQDDFTGATGGLTGQTSSATATAVAPTNVNSANLGTPPTIVHASIRTEDVDEDGTPEDYSINIDCNQNRLDDVYEWTKYILRRGGTTTTNTDDIEGQFYIGTTKSLTYDTETGTFTEGLVVTDSTTGASGTIVALHDDGTTGQLIVRLNRDGATGDFTAGNIITDTSTGSATIATSGVRTITPIKAAPFGTFAGGKFFCAPGVVLTDTHADDANNFQLTDDKNNVKTAPTKVTLAINNTRDGDFVALFRLDAGSVIEKDYYAISGTPAAGATTFDVSPTIRVDEPGKSTGGVIFVVDNTEVIEHRYRFTSWTGSSFTLFTVASATADGGGSATSLIDASVDFTSNGTVPGDIVRNTTEATYAYVVSVANGSMVTTNVGSNKPIVDWSTDAYEIGTLQEAYTSADDAYVPFIHIEETTGTDGSPGSESVSVTYVADTEAKYVARQGKVILPYSAVDTITTSGLSNNIIRTADSIAT